MILSDVQYRTAKKKLEGLEKALDAPAKPGVSARIAEAARAQTRELADEIRDEIAEYEEATHTDPAKITINSWDDLLRAPVRYRLASHMSAEAFARRVGVSARQIFRYESAAYRNCSVTKLETILDRLGVELTGVIGKD